MSGGGESLLATLWSRRDLAIQLAKRDVIGRYRGSLFGMAWSLFNPLLMLAVYTLFFTQVFQARWGAQAGGKAVFATALFVGLIVHGIVAESASRSAAVLTSNPNFVKKIVFPLEVLPWVTVLAAIFHGLLSVLVLLASVVVFSGGLRWSVCVWPLMLLPIALLCAGMAWLLAAAAVYFRDVSQIVGVLITVLLFTSPVFFPVEGLSPGFARIIALNPLTYLIEQSRELLLWGGAMDWIRYSRYTALVLAFAWIAHALFGRAKRGFADVL